MKTVALKTLSVKPILEAELSAQGKKWLVRIIATGLTGNGKFYPEEILRSSIPLLVDAPVYAAEGPDHDFDAKGVRSLAGFISEPFYYDGLTPNDLYENIPGLYANLIIVDSNLQEVIYNLKKENVLNKFVGLSIHALGTEDYDTVNGYLVVTSIVKYVSVDIVQTPAAGGEFLKLLESLRKENTMGVCNHEKPDGEELCLSCKVTSFIESSNTKTESLESQIKTFIESQVAFDPVKFKTELDEFKESLKTELKVTDSPKDPPKSIPVATLTPEVQATIDNLTESLKVSQLNNKIRVIKESEISDLAKTQLVALTESNPTLKDEDIEILINNEKDKEAAYNKMLIESLTKKGQMLHIVDATDKKSARVEAIFTPEKFVMLNGEKIKAYRTFTESYCDWYNVQLINAPKSKIANRMLKSFSFDVEDEEQMTRLTESLDTADLAEVMADKMHKAMVKNYMNQPQYQNWRKVVKIVDGLDDYQEHNRIKFGGFDDLEEVGSLGTYPELDNPVDEKTVIQMKKYGGIVSQISREAILNDDLRALADIPRELGISANRTLYRKVFKNIRFLTVNSANDNINTSNRALSGAGLDEAIRTMRNQTRFGTNDVLGEVNLPTVLIVPNSLEGIARRLIFPSDQVQIQISANTSSLWDAVRFSQMGISIVVIDEIFEGLEWILVSNPMMNEGMIVSFLGGQETPDLFIQNDPTQGDAFSKDAQNIKIRHEHTLSFTDFRPFAGFVDL